MSDRFEQAAPVSEEVLRLVEAYVLANPDPLTAPMLTPLLLEGQSAPLVLETCRVPLFMRLTMRTPVWSPSCS